MAQFKCGDFSTCDAPRPGRPKTVTTPKIIEHIHELILEDRRISAKSIAEQLGISRERVGSIIHGDLDISAYIVYQRRFKAAQTQHLNTVSSFIYFPTSCFGRSIRPSSDRRTQVYNLGSVLWKRHIRILF